MARYDRNSIVISKFIFLPDHFLKPHFIQGEEEYCQSDCKGNEEHPITNNRVVVYESPDAELDAYLCYKQGNIGKILMDISNQLDFWSIPLCILFYPVCQKSSSTYHNI